MMLVIEIAKSMGLVVDATCVIDEVYVSGGVVCRDQVWRMRQEEELVGIITDVLQGFYELERECRV